MSPKAAERWLVHMEKALDETDGIDEDSRARMWAFLKHTAWFLVAGQKAIQERDRAAAAADTAGAGEAAEEKS